MKIIVDNIATEYRDDGNGPILLLLHGWKDNLRTFDSLTPLLTGYFRVIRLDLPGFGKTEPPSSLWGLDDYINFILDFIKKLNIEVEYFVGHSFGGRIIIKGLATGKFKAKKVVLISAAGIAKSNSIRNQSYKVAAKMGRLFTLIPLVGLFRNTLKQKLYASSGSDYLDAGTLKPTFLNIIREDLSHWAGKILTPTLLIWGGQDEETPLSDGKFFARAIKNSKLVILEDGGHFVHHEKSNVVARLIKEFFV